MIKYDVKIVLFLLVIALLYAYEVEERDRKLSAYFGTSKSDNDRLVNALFGADDNHS